MRALRRAAAGRGRGPLQRRCGSEAADAARATIERVSKGQFVDNAQVPTEGGASIPVLSPRDGLQFSTLPHSSPADVDAAVRSARRAYDSGEWCAPAAAAQRAAVLRAASRALRARMAEFCHIETLDCGKPLGESEGDLTHCADLLDYYAGLAEQELAEVDIPVPEDAASAEGGGFRATSVPEPVGVVAAVTPWNFPLMQAVMKVAPALAAGCTVVLKPAAAASLSCLAFGELLRDSGAPPGVLNVIAGGPPEMLDGGKSTGESLITHPGIDKLSFTGSSAAGHRMLHASADRLRPTSLELGGKSAAVVFGDADLDAVVDWVLVGNFQASGQVCSATTRVLVEKTIERELTDRLIAGAKAIKVGDPLADGTKMGAVINLSQKGKVEAAIAKAKAEGCELHAPELQLPAELQGGYYIAPHVLTSVAADSSPWREEIFGPVMSVRSFTTEDEAVTEANNTPYGLANAVFSADADRCKRVSRRMRSGIVWENCNQALFTTTPFGGRIGTQSGFGYEGGVLGIEDYIAKKCVVHARNGYHWATYA
eukprot:TRINITY_DN891_c2_g1_i1.p1 TRINITY_DN891_c2_g1~~TRINITY_DN891_c2_g1_i1.p1  ORF type:complete len:541 (+),score=192.66 TRINITY_DN891_c2_g1_i1:1-1623(+)